MEEGEEASETSFGIVQQWPWLSQNGSQYTKQCLSEHVVLVDNSILY